jgi:hypothetical protein
MYTPMCSTHTHTHNQTHTRGPEYKTKFSLNVILVKNSKKKAGAGPLQVLYRQESGQKTKFNKIK